MDTIVMNDGEGEAKGLSTMDVWDGNGVLNERAARVFATREDVDELGDYALAAAGQYEVQEQEDGSVRLGYDPNGGVMHRVTAVRANENRGVVGREDYMAMVHEAAIHGSAMYDKTRPERMMENVFATVWMDGVEDVLGTDKETAKRLVHNEVRWVMERCGVLDENQEVKEIEQRLEREAEGAARRYSRAGQVMSLYRQGRKDGVWQVDEDEARKSVALHNIYRYHPGVRDAYWREVKGGAMPALVGAKGQVPDGEWWEEAEGFAQWYGERAEGDLKDYQEAWKVSAREEILRRLGLERSRNLDFNEVNAIVRAVVQGRGDDENGVGYDDSYRWRGVLSPDAVQRARDARVGEWRGRAVLPDGSEGLERLRGELEAGKERRQRDEAAQKEARREDQVRERRMRAAVSDVMRGQSWAYDNCDNDGEAMGVRIPAEVYRRLCADYGLRERRGGQGDEVMVELKAGSKTLYFPVIGTHEEGDEVLLNARAVGSVRAATQGRRGKYARTDWYSYVEQGADIKFHFKRTK
ncbi:MAG: hypothetical protein IJN29_05310 [Akkermansia sp.]|nr:hypothetical protein [Akkermansia sp.]